MAADFIWLKLEDINFALIFIFSPPNYVEMSIHSLTPFRKHQPQVMSCGLRRISSLSHYSPQIFSFSNNFILVKQDYWLCTYASFNRHSKADPFLLILSPSATSYPKKLQSHTLSVFHLLPGCHHCTCSGCLLEFLALSLLLLPLLYTHQYTQSKINQNINYLYIQCQVPSGICSVSCLSPCLNLHEVKLPIFTAIAKQGGI